MATPSYIRPLVNATKRLKLSPNAISECPVRTPSQYVVCPHIRSQQRRRESTVTAAASGLDQVSGAAEAPQPTIPPLSTSIDPRTAAQELQHIRLPRAVQATYLNPLRHKPTHNIKMADLQIRSYSVRNLEVFTDFCLRAAYYLKLPAKGPIFLPRITERWTVPRSNFVHKKSQENFQRITLRRSIEIVDGHPETVAAWLAFVKKHQYYGVGMKANVWEYGGLKVGQDLDMEAESIAEKLGEQMELIGGRRSLMKKEDKVKNMLSSEPFKARWGAYTAMGGAQSVPNASKRTVTKMIG